MVHKIWNDVRLSSKDEDYVWELFHENSKMGRTDNFLSQEAVHERMLNLVESLPFDQYPKIDLPTTLPPLDLSLEAALITRVTARRLEPCPLTIENVAIMLYYAYGTTRNNIGTVFPRPFRIVPSGGALYPLEIFFHSAHIEGLQGGIYHYNSPRNQLSALHYGNESRHIADAMPQGNLPFDASLIIFITAMFERSVFKYGNRGYRFVLLEAGHVAQNINLVSNALNLGCVNIGGYFDHQIDDLLGLDGVTHSTVYMLAIGRRSEESQETVEAM